MDFKRGNSLDKINNQEDYTRKNYHRLLKMAAKGHKIVAIAAEQSAVDLGLWP